MQDLFVLLQANTGLFLGLVLVTGLIVGSFLNVVIHRLPIIMERQWREQCAELHGEAPQATTEQSYSLVRPRSACPHCGHAITARENIPVVSYLMLRGRCSACGARISARYPIVELSCAILSAIVAWRFGVTVETAAGLILTWSLIALAVIDLDTQYLPDSITLPLLWLGLLASLFSSRIATEQLIQTPEAAIIGAAAGYLSLWSVYQAFKLATGKEGMGFGDFKLLAALGAWLGWQQLLPVVLISAVVGAIVGIGMIAMRRHEREVPIPYGPFLAAAGWVAMLWGDTLVGAWLGYMGGP